MAKRFVELSQPLFNGMPRAKAHGDVKFWADRVCVNHASGSFQVCITHLEMAAVELKISILGVDTIPPDLPGPFRSQGFDFPVHTRLLGNDILVIENLGDERESTRYMAPPRDDSKVVKHGWLSARQMGEDRP